MPQSKHRKGRKPYRPRPVGVYGANPLEMFQTIGRGQLGADEEEAACLLLLKDMKEYDEKVMQGICTMAGLSEPPSTTDHIRAIAKALVSEEPHATQS